MFTARKTQLKRIEKPYVLKQSPFFHLTYIPQLAKLLNISELIINRFLENIDAHYHTENKYIKGKIRKICYPQNNLYILHNRIASLLSRIKTPAYLHSSKPNYSYITNAKAHLQSKEVFTCDLKNFFPSTNKAMVFRFFRNQMQCSHQISNILAQLCVTQEDNLPTGSQISEFLAFGQIAQCLMSLLY